MDSSSLKGLEFLVIIGAVVWFYVSQQNKLKRLKAEREAKTEQAAPKAETKAGDD
ncbi:hypothetical protein [uncultured Thiohalocapsa sp.]|uniref:hypothetical protein n=1 Tax=uncultured Thiohalocapsa sp. TaxID=768990 RepID=UPI0025F517F5|nr:hypothetical protein [uncultured Thiohalocapsa sp.]